MRSRWTRAATLALLIPVLVFPAATAGLVFFVPPPEQLNADEDGGDRDTAVFLHEALLADLAVRGLEIAATGYDLVLHSSFSLDQLGRLVVSVRITDPDGRITLFGRVYRARTGITLLTTISEIVDDLTAAISALPAVPSWESLFPPPPFVNRLVVSSPDDGAEVILAGAHATAVIREGAAEIVDLAILPGSAVTVELRKPGYRPLRVTFDSITGESVLAMPAMARQLRYAGTVSWSLARAAGFGAGGRFFVVPDWAFLGVEGYLHRESDQPWLESRILAGSYLIAPPERRLRLGYGVALELHTPLEEAPDVEVGFNFATIWMEYGLRRIAPYLQVELTYLRSRGVATVTAGVRLPGMR
jgi:hypothetical protein